MSRMKMTQIAYFAQGAFRLVKPSRRLSSSSPFLTVEPSCALMDEPVSIRVSGFQPHQKITLSALLRGEDKEFVSCAHYTADGSGHVDASVQSSEGGSFSGVEPMGLFWAMIPSDKHRKPTRLLKRDVTVPYDITIAAWLNHIHLKSIQSSNNSPGAIAVTRSKRWYLQEGVHRIPVREGRLRGTLLIPPGTGPFPAVLDIYGGTGGLLEFRAALLASRGYLTLALAYLGYEGLPERFDELDYGYFHDAAEMLSQHPQASDGGIGVIGTSAVANMLASFCQNCQIHLNPGNCFSKHVDELMINTDEVRSHSRGVSYTEPCPVLSTSRSTYTRKLGERLPIWRQDVKILSLVGDDRTVSPMLYRRLMKEVPGDKIHNIQKMLVLFGGEMKGNAVAQEDSWRRILEHFNKFLAKRNTDGNDAS